jgi:hypothetical protein
VNLLRRLLIGIAVLAVLMAVVVGLAFMPSVQTWAAHRALAGRNIEVGRVAVGLHRVELDNVQVNQPGVALTLPGAEVDLSLLSAAGKKVSIQKLVAKGWTLDLTAPGAKSKPAQAAAAPAVATAAAFQGIFQKLHLPVDLSVDSVELSGDVIFSADPKQPTSHAHVTLIGGGLAAGQEGKFAFEIDSELAGSSAAVHTLAVHGTLTATLDTPRTFSHLGFVTDGTATGPRFPQGARIHFVVDALRAATDENYTVALDTEGKHLFSLDASFKHLSSLNSRSTDASRPAPKLVGGWQLNMRDTDLAPFTLGRALPVFEATGDGKFEANAALNAVHATGHLHVSAGQLEVIHAGLQALGSLTLDTQFDLSQNAGVTRIDQFDAIVAGTHPVAEVRALQSFEFIAKTKELKVADPAKDLFSFFLQGLPLAWAQPFLSGLTVDGSDATGTVLVSAHDGGMHFQSSEPMEVKNFSVTRAGQPLARLDVVTLSLDGDYTLSQGWQAELTASAQAGSKTLFTLQAKAGAIAGPGQPIKATGQLLADLPAVMAQPAFAAKAQSITGGAARIDFQASLDEKKEIEAKLALTGLASPQAPSLPTVTADMRAELAPDGQIAFNAPLLFENAGRKSDLTFSGTFKSGAGGMNLDARIASDLIVADDVKILAAPLAMKRGPVSSAPQAAASAANPETATVTPDKLPFWNGVSGHLVLALKKVVYGQFEVSDITGDLKIGPDALALDQLRAVLGSGGEARLAGAVNFAGDAPEPYAMKANVAVSEVDSAPLFRALDPSKPPTVEGKFNLSGQVTSSGINAVDLGQQAQGDGTLTGKSGVFRFFDGLTKIYSELSGATKVAGFAAKLGGVVSAVTGQSSYGDIANKAQAVLEVSKILAAIDYDQLNVTVSRDQQLNTQLKDFTLISPEMRLQGNGQVTYQAGTPFMEQPLAAEFKLSARGHTADLLNYLGALDSQTDELGYATCPVPLKAGGTLSHPDTKETEKKFLGLAAASNAASGLLNRLWGK